MRTKSLLLIFIALGCGLVASIGISQVMDRGSGGGGMEMEQILVTLADIDIGTKFDAQNVKLEDWPKAKIPDGAIRKLDDVKDKFANARFYKGEPLHINKVADKLGNITIKIQEGYRVMPVKVDEDTVMKGISPGDRVDVMVFLRRNGQDIDKTGAFTILRNVRVFAVNTSTERATDAKGETTNFRTVSLLVKPDHARELAVAAQMGKILLTLRRPDEKDDSVGESVTPLEEILSGRAKNASDASAASPPSSTGPGLLQVIKSAGGPAPNAANSAAGSLSSAEPEWVMEVISPAERKRFEWQDKKGLPSESTVSSSAAPAANAPLSGSGDKDASPDSPAPPTGSEKRGLGPKING